MAQKRMFDKTITNDDLFLEMPLGSQVLYFHLSMNADDDGFVNNWKSIMKMTGTKEDELRVLIAKKYIIPFDSGIIVIRHWRINNYLRSDRHTPTKYQEELAMLESRENNEYQLKESGYTDGIPMVYPDKNSIDNICPSEDEPVDDKANVLLDDFEKIWVIYPRKDGKSKAFKSYKTWLKGKKVFNQTIKLTNKQMWLAVKKYADESNGKDKTYIKMGSTFFNDAILDYVEESDE